MTAAPGWARCPVQAQHRVDLKDPAGRDALRRLVGTADVFVQNMRFDAVRRLGLAFRDVARRTLVPSALQSFRIQAVALR